MPVIYEHFHRYLWAAHLVDGLRVLDLGSGEGFGAAALAESAAHVLGVDVDERTVEHSRLNYGGPNLKFELGTALDLSAHGDGSFGAVVAFELIEHVGEQERVLAEVARVLGDAGILLISTPDRAIYGTSRTEPDPFHERPLDIDEFLELLGRHFPHHAAWGQRTIAGSHLHGLGDVAQERWGGASDFFIERAGEEWRIAGEPATLYCVALASKAPLAAAPASSTLADCGLELIRVKERDTATAIREKEELAIALEGEMEEQALTFARERTEHANALRERSIEVREERDHRDQEILRAQEDFERSHEDAVRRELTILELRERAAALEGQVASARQASRRIEESVTWQAFQKARRRLYRLIGGERSLLARALGASLRLVGRRFIVRPQEAAPDHADSVAAHVADVIQLPKYDNPRVSMVIPLYAQAELTRACLHSIREHTRGVPYEVILVDDAADVETRRLLDEVRGANVLRNEKNIGYLRSVNRGASVARGQWLVLFNNDTEVTRGWLSAMLDCADSAPDVGVVTPKYIYPDGSLNEAGGVIWRDGTGTNYGRGDAPHHFQYEYRRETDYGSAAALMVSAQLWNDVGGFDERFLPMYYEDADLCFEARKHGLRVLYEPEAVIVHVEGATAGNDADSGHKRYQERNRPKFVAKWRTELETEHRYPAPTSVRMAANRHRGQHVLVIDHRVPMWDRDAGSLRILRIMEALIGIGARVTFMPDNLTELKPYTRSLQRLGIEVLYGHLDINAELAAIGPRLSAAILCRPHATSHWLDTVREFAPAATVVYDTVDLHWLREARRGAVGDSLGALGGDNGNPNLDRISPKAKALRQLELAMIRATDATIVVSDCERRQVERDVPGAKVLVVPTVHDVEPHVSPPADRSGVLFLGSFEHVPNVDAAVRLVKEVMPAVWRELGDVPVTVVGSSPPSEVQALISARVDVTGWVKDLQPLLERSRLMAAPLRFGAGLKGKITQCLAVGLPVVTTAVGAEGLDARDGETMLIADDPGAIAERIIGVYRDDDLWNRLSVAGQAVVSNACSPELVAAQMRLLLDDTRSENLLTTAT